MTTNTGLVELKVKDFKKLHCAHITKDGAITMLGGDNGAGKSACLDAIRLLYGGKRAVTGTLLRDGTSDGYIEGLESDGTVTKLSLDTMRKTITKVGSKAKTSGVQAECNKKAHLLSFDPSSFFTKSAVDQTNIILELHGISFDEVDAQYKEEFEKRTIQNREVKRLEGAYDTFYETNDVPEKEPKKPEPLGDLLVEQLELTQEINEGKTLLTNIDALAEQNKQDEEEIKRLQYKLDEGIKLLITMNNRLLEIKEHKPSSKLATISEKLANIEADTAKYDNFHKASVMLDELNGAQHTSGQMTYTLETITGEKNCMINDIDWAIRGMAYDPEINCVTWHGRPINEASDGEGIVIGVALVMALQADNTDCLKVMLLQNAAMLDGTNRDIIRKMAEYHGWWIIMELPHADGCDVLVVDGTVETVKEGEE